ncbi:MAG TPA: sigma-54 dependent transcriptional regulator [Myxococcota bacterium]|nr:sigma-54 dependent transcriptional regulator [Myxococcota bacterium]
MATVLVADDESNLRKVLKVLLERDGHRAITVGDGPSALAAVKAGGIDIIITDLKMPGMTGLELLQAVKGLEPGLPVIVITAHGTVDTAVSALKNGAFDYITKPFERDELELTVRKAAAVRHSTQHRLQDAGDPRGRFRIIGQSRRMSEIYTVIEKVASTPSTVLITGESGTGKELVASALHENSPRKGKPFIKVNCGAIPKDLMESEFFGYEQGAFTGAVASKPGRFELADGGTLFLDEIAEIPNAMQVKLLRALQESEFERVGGVRTIRVDVRLIAATNRDLATEIAEGNFREDLYYRLNVVPIALPALRDRREDVPLLTYHFVEKYNKRLGKNVTQVTDDALAVLAAHAWPGNIRELENVVERTLLFTDHPEIGVEDLPEELRRATGLTQGPGTGPVPTPMPAIETGSASMKDIVRQATSNLERDLIIKALDETRGNVTRAAHLLQISRKGLQNKMKEFGLRETEGSGK